MHFVLPLQVMKQTLITGSLITKDDYKNIYQCILVMNRICKQLRALSFFLLFKIMI